MIFNYLIAVAYPVLITYLCSILENKFNISHCSYFFKKLKQLWCLHKSITPRSKVLHQWFKG